MRKTLLLVAIFLTVTSAAVALAVDHLLISEIQIDSIDGSGGAQDDFIQIHNPLNADFDLAAEGYRLERWTSGGTRSIVVRFGDESDASFPGGTLIPAGGFYLVVDADADDENLLNAADALVSRTFALAEDYTIALGIGPMSEGITDEDLVDLVGFGSNELFEGSAAAGNPPARNSLARQTEEGGALLDTDDNSIDFEILTTPDLRNSTFIPANQNPLPAENSAPDIPTELSPIVTTNSKTFSAQYSDPDQDSGSIEFRLFTVSPTDCADEENLFGSGVSATVDSATVAEWTPEELADEEYFWCARASDDETNSAWAEIQNFTLDTVAPAFLEGSELVATAGDTEVLLAWPSAEEAEKYFLRVDGGEPEDLGAVKNFMKTNLANGHEFEFAITGVDAAGNESVPLTATAMPEAPRIFVTAEMGEIVFNEVAWMGSVDSANDEWIEIFNTTANKNFDFTGWKIMAADGTPEIELAGQINASEFFLLERTDDDSAPGVAANQIFTGGLGNDGEVLILLDSAGTEIDRVDGSDSWSLGGDNNSKKTLVRIADGNYRTSFEVGGTPRMANFREHNLAVTAVATTPANPLPGAVVTLTAELENRGTSPESFSLEWLVDDSVVTTVENISLASFATSSETFEWNSEAGSHTLAARIQFAADENPDDNANSLTLVIQNHLLISEFVVNPEGSDEFNEWAEIYNSTEDAVDLTDFELNGATLSGSIAAGEYLVFSAELAGWDTLPNSSGSFTLRDSAGEVLDEASYTTAAEKKSHGRKSTDLGQWTEFWHPTPGAENIEINTDPIAVITIQGSGQVNGGCSLYVNLTGENSSDPDSDELFFEWDFGNGETSDEENPSGFYFFPGNYTVTLTVTDVLGATSEATQGFFVSQCSSRVRVDDSNTETEEPILNSVSAERVELKITEVSFDSAADWVEVWVANDGNNGQGIDLQGFYFEADKRVKTIPPGTKLKTGEFLLLTFKSENPELVEYHDSVWKIYSDHSGLTKTDEQLTLRDSSGRIEDAVVWENRSGAWSRGEEADVSEIVKGGGWDSIDPMAAVDSSVIQREVVIARKNTEDTDSTSDWFATPFATPGAENGNPPTAAEEIELLILEVAPKNPTGDFVKLICRDCGEVE
ncbi:MAG: lamin tail domain-containing protein, partial [Patescibacteria group bacterium]